MCIWSHHDTSSCLWSERLWSWGSSLRTTWSPYGVVRPVRVVTLVLWCIHIFWRHTYKQNDLVIFCHDISKILRQRPFLRGALEVWISFSPLRCWSHAQPKYAEATRSAIDMKCVSPEKRHRILWSGNSFVSRTSSDQFSRFLHQRSQGRPLPCQSRKCTALDMYHGRHHEPHLDWESWLAPRSPETCEISHIGKAIVFMSLLLLFSKGHRTWPQSDARFYSTSRQLDMHHITTYAKHESAKMNTWIIDPFNSLPPCYVPFAELLLSKAWISTPISGSHLPMFETWRCKSFCSKHGWKGPSQWQQHCSRDFSSAKSYSFQVLFLKENLQNFKCF